MSATRLGRLASVALLAGTCVVAVVLPSASPAQAAGPTQPVGVKITRVACTSDCDADGLESTGESTPDFYAKVFIDGQEFITPRAPDDQSDIHPNWVVTKDVPTTDATADIAIQIWDEDSTSGDDLADDTPRSDPNGSNLQFQINLTTHQYAGDVTTPTDCAEGNGDGDGDVKVCFEPVFSTTGDLDGDGFSDGQEINGIDGDYDGVIDYRLPDASFRHKDLYVESDWVTHPGGASFAPQSGAIQDVVDAFAAAPLSNPDGVNGINLHVQLDEAISMPNQIITFKTRGLGSADDFDDFKLSRANPAGSCPGTFGTAAERALPTCAAVLAAKKIAYRYMWFGDQFEVTGSSGSSELTVNGGNDFIVAMGALSAATINAAGGRRAAEAATFMHEFGHDLGLAHGGRTGTALDPVNCKPNYFSVMNYILQFNTFFSGSAYTRPLTYSQGTAPPLAETSLNENAGLGGPAGQQSAYSLPAPGLAIQTVPATGPVDWNGNGTIDTGTVPADIDNMPSQGADCASRGPSETLNDRDDWDNLHYTLTDSSQYADGIARSVPDELTNDEILAVAPADVSAAITAPASVTAGAAITATATAANAGPGVAKQVGLSIAQTGATTVTTQVGPISAGASVTRTQTLTTSCDVTDGSVVTSTATVAATGAAGQPDINPLNDTASVTTTVRKPVPVVSVAAAASANSGEALPVTVSYHNTGSLAATGVTATVTVPKDVYYSTPLDPTGSPRPTSVVRHTDGTTTLTWALADVPAGGGGTITFTVRPSLLLVPGTMITLAATLTTNAANGCPALSAGQAAITTVTAPNRSGLPVSTVLRSLAVSSWTPETLARIQATDQRFDGADGSTANGALATGEVRSVYGINLLLQKQLRAELLTTEFNLAERKFNANTALRLWVISPVLTTPATAGDAVRQAEQILNASTFDPIAAAKLLTVLVPLDGGLLT